MSEKRRPWNKGLRGHPSLLAAWTPERRQQHSDTMRAKGLKGQPRPDLWHIPDQRTRQHYYRFLRARTQARWWSQPWQLTWPQYLEITREHIDNMGRKKSSMNLVRKDTAGAWSVDNCEVRNRLEVMHRRFRTGERQPKGSRQVPPGQGSKQRGRKWLRRQLKEVPDADHC